MASSTGRSDRAELPLTRHGRIATAAAVVGCVFFAWQNRFIQDDAYISWTYARQLADGHGLVWAGGEAVEGYTNFLWTMIAAIPHAIGWDVIEFTYVFGMVLFAGTLLSVRELAKWLSGSETVALASLLATGLFYSVSSYATGGLETQLQTVLILRAAVACLPMVRGHSSMRAGIRLGLWVLLAILTRLDSVVLLFPMIVIVGASRIRKLPRAIAARPLVAASIVAGVGVGIWFLWKLGYYGSILPNSFQAKVDPNGDWIRGFQYLRAFVWSYSFFLPGIGAALGVVVAGRSGRREDWLLLIAAGTAWMAYVVGVGGDFMEFRMLVPAIPLWIALGCAGLSSFTESRSLAVVAAVLVLAGSEHHRQFYTLETYRAYDGPEPIESLEFHLAPRGEAWEEIGMRLGAAFAGVRVAPTLAVTPAGAIVYYSRLAAIDMLGINDKGIARFTEIPGMVAGHNRLISLAELESRNAHFLIAHPVIRPQPPGPDYYFHFEAFSADRFFRFEDEERLRGRRIIEMPLSSDRVLLMVYLTEHPAISARLAELGWRVYPAQ